MIQLINKKIKLAYILTLAILCSCSDNKETNRNAEVILQDKNDLKEIHTSEKTALTYIGSEIIISKTQPKEYSKEQAQEILKHLQIYVSSDSINVEEFCKFKVFKEAYNSNKMKYDTESLIVNDYGLSESSVICISNFNGINEGCGLPFSKLIQSNNKIIYFDKGYFFSFKERENKTIDNYKINTKTGIVGDTRQEWMIAYTYSNNLEKTYEDFINRFPFGSMNIEKSIVVEDQFDKTNDIQYTYKPTILEIKKNISVGTIYITFKSISQDITEVEYYLSFPFENSDYGG